MWGNVVPTHTPNIRLSHPCGSMGTAGDDASGPTSTDGRFSTIHTPYCSHFLLDLKETKKHGVPKGMVVTL